MRNQTEKAEKHMRSVKQESGCRGTKKVVSEKRKKKKKKQSQPDEGRNKSKTTPFFLLEMNCQ